MVGSRCPHCDGVVTSYTPSSAGLQLRCGCGHGWLLPWRHYPASDTTTELGERSSPTLRDPSCDHRHS
ncbi:MAG: hypothetical protein ACM33T_03715 [Solirubrobacterales bacterium]